MQIIVVPFWFRFFECRIYCFTFCYNNILMLSAIIQRVECMPICKLLQDYYVELSTHLILGFLVFAVAFNFHLSILVYL